MREVIAIVKMGIDLDRALEFSRKERVAMLIVSGEIDGGEFDYSLWQWKKKT